MGPGYIIGQERNQPAVKEACVGRRVPIGRLPVHASHKLLEIIPEGSHQEMAYIICQGTHLLKEMASG